MIWRVLVLTLVAAVPSTARAAWTRVDSPHFIVYGNASPEKLRKFTERVERFDAVLRKFTALDPARETPNRLTIFVVPGISDVQRQIGKDKGNVAGFYTPVLTGPIAVIPASLNSGDSNRLQADTVLFHEYVHHFMLQYFPVAYPPWYVEGFAEYWSTTEFKDNGDISFGLPARFRFYNLVVGPPFPLKRMFAPDMGRLNDEETGRFYAWSWLLTHYLNLSPDRKGQLDTYLKAFAEGKSPADAAQQAFGSLDTLQSDLVRYRDRRSMGYMTVKALELPTAKTTVTPLDATQSALMPLYIRFSRGSPNPAEVAEFVADARQMAARYPGDPRALELLAEGELDAKQFDAANAANDALLAARPADARALLRRARIAAGRLGDKGDPADWKAVRALIVKANRAAPDDPFILAEYYRSFGREGVAPPPLATDGLVRALELAPQVRGLRFMLATRLMQLKRVPEARIVLAPMLNEPHNPAARTAARAILDGATPAPSSDDAGDGGTDSK